MVSKDYTSIEKEISNCRHDTMKYISITENTNKYRSLCWNVPKDTRVSKTNSVPYGHEVISRMRYERPKDTRYQRYRRAMVRILSLCYQRTEFQNIKRYWVSKIPTPDDSYTKPYSIRDTKWLSTKRYQTIPVSKIPISDDSYTEPYSIKDTKWLSTKVVKDTNVKDTDTK